MTISIGDKLPAASFQHMGPQGPESISTGDLTKGRRIVIFGLPGAFTGTCTTAHVPSFIRNAKALADKGVDEIICVSVNDIHVMKAWAESTGGAAAGIRFLSDGDGSFAAALGLQFDVPVAAMFRRSKRYAMLIEDGIVTRFNPEASPGVCETSAAETLLDQI